jgi:hypothetical protein
MLIRVSECAAVTHYFRHERALRSWPFAMPESRNPWPWDTRPRAAHRAEGRREQTLPAQAQPEYHRRLPRPNGPPPLSWYLRGLQAGRPPARDGLTARTAARPLPQTAAQASAITPSAVARPLFQDHAHPGLRTATSPPHRRQALPPAATGFPPRKHSPAVPSCPFSPATAAMGMLAGGRNCPPTAPRSKEVFGSVLETDL